MAILKCKSCGQPLNLSGTETVIECEYCGLKQTVPTADNEKKVALFSRANDLRLTYEFDKAAGVYEAIIGDFPEEAEAYWGLVLCKYGIEYVDDVDTNKKVPTCHRLCPTPIVEDSDYLHTIENANIVAKDTYKQSAEEINDIQKQILSIALKEKPYDIFICFKDKDENGDRTEDSSIAQDIYTELTREGYKVFFSRITLRSHAGTEYEPYIYAALSSANVMLSLGTKFEYFDAVWVKNEWSRFISMMRNDKTKTLIPCYKDMEIDDMPREFRNMQALDMDNVMFFSDLLESVKRVVGEKKSETVHLENNTATSIAPLLKRANMFLEDSAFSDAINYCEKVLDIDPECAEAYLIKVCAQKKKSTFLVLGELPITDFLNSSDYQKAVKFADDSLKRMIEKIEKAGKTSLDVFLENERIAKEYAKREYENKFRLKNQQTRLLNQYVSGSDRNVCLVRENGTVCLYPIEGKETALEGVKRRQDIVTVYDDYSRLVVLTSQGDTICIGENAEETNSQLKNWHGVIKIVNGDTIYGIVGILADGSVVSWDRDDKLLADWTDIVDVKCDRVSRRTYLGLKSDGHVVVAGEKSSFFANVSEWKDIVQIQMIGSGIDGASNVYGLRKDGTVLAIGSNIHGQCNVAEWRDVIYIYAASYYDNQTIFGIKKDGTVLVTGSDKYNQHRTQNWNDIIDIQADGNYNTFGLKIDGTVVAIGEKFDSDILSWDNIVALNGEGIPTVGLKSNGTVILSKNIKGEHCYIGTWKLFNDLEATVEKQANLISTQKKKLLPDALKTREIIQNKVAAEIAAEQLKRQREEEKNKKLQEKKDLQNAINDIEGQIAEKRKKLSCMGLLSFGRKKDLQKQIDDLSSKRGALKVKLESLCKNFKI